MANKILLLIISVCFAFSFAKAQPKAELDSLVFIIKNEKSDTIRLTAMNTYAYALRKTKLDSSLLLSLNVLKETKSLLANTNNSLLKRSLKDIQLKSYSNLFIVYRRSYQIFDAIDLHSEIANVLTSYENNLTKAGFYSNYAEIYIGIGNIKEAINYYNLAREIYQEYDDKDGIAGSYYNMAKIMFLQQEFEQSIVFGQEALKTIKETKNVMLSSFCFNLLANGYVSMADQYTKKETKDSLFQLGSKYYLLSLKIKEEYNDVGAQVITLNNLSNIEYSRKQYKTALDYLEKALKLSVKVKSDQLITNTYITYGTVYFEMGELDEALFYLENAYILSKKIQNLDFTKFSSQYLSQIYKKKNDYDKALKYYEIYTRLKDSTLNEEYVNKILSYEQTLKYQQKQIADSIKHSQESQFYQLEIHKKEAQISQKQTLRNWLFSIIISLLLLSFFIYKNYKNQFKARNLLASKNVQIQKQNEILEEQKSELNDINSSLKKAYQDKIDSIKYAKRIQATTFPTEESIKKALPQSFIIYKPLDIVSGDFYWVREIDDKIIIALGDSTGHGVPGAFMSIMGIAILKELVNSRENLIAADILGDIRQRIIESLRHYSTDDVEEHYGMDLGIVIYSKSENSIQYSGAFTPLYIVRNPNNLTDNSNMLIKAEADKMPISLYPKMDPYTNHIYNLNEGDMFYMFTDGTTAQYGGDNAKKLGSKLFIDKLVENSLLPIDEQKVNIEKFLSDWKVHINPGTGEHFLQTDDITIIGVRV